MMDQMIAGWILCAGLGVFWGGWLLLKWLLGIDH